METFRISLENEPTPQDIQFLEDRLMEYNLSHTGSADRRRFTLMLRDDRDRIVAGLYGWIWAGWLEVRYLWVDQALRGKGYGRELLLAAEREGIANGCRNARLDTFSYQAPGFYEKCGYQRFAALDSYPGPHQKLFYWKPLGLENAERNVDNT